MPKYGVLLNKLYKKSGIRNCIISNNHCMVLYMNEQEVFLEESDYEQENLLSRNQINVYQFDVQENQKTKIRKLSWGDYGFEVATSDA